MLCYGSLGKGLKENCQHCNALLWIMGCLCLATEYTALVISSTYLRNISKLLLISAECFAQFGIKDIGNIGGWCVFSLQQRLPPLPFQRLKYQLSICFLRNLEQIKPTSCLKGLTYERKSFHGYIYFLFFKFYFYSFKKLCPFKTFLLM